MVEVLSNKATFPECPTFDSNGDLWYVDTAKGEVVKWNRTNSDRYQIGGGPTGITFSSTGDILICDNQRDRLMKFDPSTQTKNIILNKLEHARVDGPNDMLFDKNGLLIVTCSGDPDTNPEDPTQAILGLRKDGSVFEVASDMIFPNGLTFTPSGKNLIVAETYANRLVTGSWDPDTEIWTNVDTFAQVDGTIGPDGLTVDDKGRVYAAVFGGGKVQILSRKGEHINKILTPGDNPTNLTFDPTGDLGLVVTETEEGKLLSYPEIVTKTI